MKMRYSGSRSPNAKGIHSSTEKWVQLRNCEGKLEYDGLPRLKFDPTIPYEALHDTYAYEHGDSTAMPDTSYVSAVEQWEYSNSEEIKSYLLSVCFHAFRDCVIMLSPIDNLGCDFHVVAKQGVYVDDVIPNYRQRYRLIGGALHVELLARYGKLLPSFCCSLIELRQKLKALVSYMLKHSVALSVFGTCSLEIDFSYADVSCFQIFGASNVGGAL